MQYKAKVDKKYMEYLHDRAEQSKVQRQEQEARAARIERQANGNWRQMTTLPTVSGNNMKTASGKLTKAGIFTKIGRGAAGLKRPSSRASSRSSLGYSVEGDGAGDLDYAAITQFKAAAEAMRHSKHGKQQSKLETSFSEEKKASR